CAAPRVLGDTIAGKFLDVSTNPALRDALGMARSNIASLYGGSAGQNFSNSGFQENIARGLGCVAAQAYQQERQNQLNALQLASSVGNADVNQLAGVGAQQEALKQQQFLSPFENLQRYQSALQGNFGGTTT